MTFPSLALFFVSATTLAAAPVGISSIGGNPLKLQDGVPAFLGFPSWAELEPIPGNYDFTTADALVSKADATGTEITGIFHQLAPWASSGNETEAFPLVNRKAWSEYITTLVDRYKGITHWDVLGSFNLGNPATNTPLHYVELLTAAHDMASRANPSARIGFSLADYDLEFLEETLRSGAGGKFDYVSLSPFQYTPGSDAQFATMLPTVRALLASYDLPGDIPVRITLAGSSEDLPGAAALATSLGFDRVFILADAASLEKVPEQAPPLPQQASFDERDSVELVFGKTNKNDGIYQTVPGATPWDAEYKAARSRFSESSCDPHRLSSRSLLHLTRPQ